MVFLQGFVCCSCKLGGTVLNLTLPVQAARKAVTSMEAALVEAQAHMQESLSIQNDVILQVSYV